MSSWVKIRRLQAALDEVQASSTSHKLYERNCIEVVSKLVEPGMGLDRLVSVLYKVVHTVVSRREPHPKGGVACETIIIIII